MKDETDKFIDGMLDEPEEKDEIVVVLTSEQKDNIIKAWRAAPSDNPPSLKGLIEIAFPGMDFDGRSKQGKAVRDFLATYKVFPKTNAHEKIGEYELTFAEKEFIQNNIDSMKHLEMAKTLWGPKTGPLSKYFRALKKYIDSEVQYKPQAKEQIEDSNKFDPPKTYNECLRLINRFNHDILSTADISEKQKHGIYTLIRYLNSPRFIKTLSTFKDDGNQNLFLAEFIRATYDKSDLTVDELNLYISLAASYPLEQMALAEREALSQKLEEETITGRISPATVEAINAKNDEYKDCQIRQEKLIKELNGSRSKRIDSQRSANASIMSLIEYAREEKKRAKLIKLGDIKKKAESECAQELFNMKSVVAEIFGAIPSEP